MINKESFIKKTGFTKAEIDNIWEDALGVAQAVNARLPDIGFMSASKRLSAFFVACEYFQQLIYEETISFNVAIVSVLILRFSDKRFDKAYGMFQIRVMQKRLGGVGRLNDFAYQLARQIDPYF